MVDEAASPRTLIVFRVDLDVAAKRQLKYITLAQYHDPARLRSVGELGVGEWSLQQPVNRVAAAALDVDDGRVVDVLADDQLGRTLG